ncbi:RNA polymerase sigma factor [Singulisphaera rosea]
MSNDVKDDLIERLNGGDKEAAERLFAAYEPYLRMAVRRQLSGPLRSKLDSMDVVQSIWANVLRGFRVSTWHFNDREHVKAFLMRAVKNRLIDRRRQFHRALELEQPLASTATNDLPSSKQARPSELAQGEELWERILALCPPSHQEVVRLKRQGLPLAQIAARTGYHVGSVRRILYDLAKRMADDRKDAMASTPKRI